MVYSAAGDGSFALNRTSDGFDTIVDKSQTLAMMLQQLEYSPDKQPYKIKIVTADDEKYEIEPVAAGEDMGEKICNIALE